MADSKEPKKVSVKKVEKKERPDYEPAPETEMNFMTEEEDKKRKRNITIGIIIGVLIAALAIWAVITQVQKGQVQGNEVTVSTSRATTKPGSLEPSNTSTTRTYVTRQLTVHKDEKGVWRSYAGLEKTVGYTGVVGNDTGWWMVVNDLVDFNYNGIGENDYGEWMIENGKVNLKYSGKFVYENRLYTIKDGKVVYSEKIVPTTTTTTATTTTTTATTTTTEHIHDWVPVYDGNATTDMLLSYCMCPECGLKFANRSLLEDHAEGTGHKLSAEAADDVYRADEPVEVITGYDHTSYKCSECGATTDKID